MDKKRLNEIMANKDNMSTPELLSAISEVSKDLHKITGDKKYKNVAEASGTMSYAISEGFTDDEAIKMALCEDNKC